MAPWSTVGTVSRPNFLLISIDSLRHDFCSFLNDAEETTPFLDEFARNSTVYEQAISPSTWTLPVHTSIFTGLYPREHQVNDGETILGDHPTFAEILQEQGYETRSFTHNGWFQTGEITRGFEHEHTPMPGMVGDGLANLKKGVRNRSINPTKNGLQQIVEAPFVKGRKAVFRHRLKGARTVNNAATRLERCSTPFCYLVHLNDVHHLYRPNIDNIREFSSEGIRALHENVLYQQKLKSNRDAIYTGNFEIDEERLPLIRDLYRASIRQTDALVRELLETLSQVNESENTIVIIFGDHGDLIGEYGLFGHAFSVADELIRVPLLVHDPTERIPPRREQSIVQLNDLYPTILELARASPPSTNSISLMDGSRDAAFVDYEKADSDLEFPSTEYPPFKQYAVWKSPSSRLVTYPEEDGVADEGSLDLKEELNSHFAGLDPVAPKGEVELSDATRQRLEEMGYL